MSFSSLDAVFEQYRATHLYQQGKEEEAQRIFIEGLVDNYQDWRMLYNLGTIALNNNAYQDAINYLEKTVALCTDPVAKKEAERRLAIARERLKKEQDEKKKQQEEKQKQDQQQEQEQEKSEQEKGSSKQNKQKQDQQQPENQDKQKSEQQKQQQSQQNTSQQQDGQKQEKDKSQESESAAPFDSAPDFAKATTGRQDERNRQAERKKESVAAKQVHSAFEDKRFTKQEAQAFEELDKLDQELQSQLLHYAVASQEPAKTYGKNW